MEGRSVLRVRKASSLLTTLQKNANNGLSKYMNAHTRSFSPESFDVMKGKCNTSSQLL